jgi:hypothetical protein
MEEWSSNSQTYYSIILAMNFSAALANGSSQKIFSLEVRVNPSGYVTVVGFNVSYCCTDSNAESHPNTSETEGAKPSVLKSVGSIIMASNYTNRLISILEGHSTGLKRMTGKMIDFSPT